MPLNASRSLLPCCCAALTLIGAQARAQLAPDRLYYGVNRSIPMQVAIPQGKTGDARIDGFPATETTPTLTAFVAKGGVDLASLFPSLWTASSPKLMYAQLIVGQDKVGPPVVLQPMLNPTAAMLYNEHLHEPWFHDP